MNIKTVLKLAITILLAPIICTLMMITAYSLPVQPMINHARQSQQVIQHSEMEQWTGGTHFTSIDYETDFIMAFTAVYPTTSSSIIKDSMLNPQYNFTSDFSDAISNPSIYPRFWHGYVLWLKPLLLCFDFNEIKIFNLFIQIILFSLTLLSIHSRFGLNTAFAFAFTYFALNPISNILSLQSALMTITLLSILFLIHNEKKLFQNDNYLLLFLITGIATSFFEFMTYPLITLGIPMVIALLLNKNTKTSNLWKILILGSICWTAGYGLFWASKWIISYLLTGHNTLSDAFSSITQRLGEEPPSGTYDLSFLSVTHINAYQIFQPPILLAFGISVVAMIVPQIRKKECRIKLNIIIPNLFLAIYPLIWFFVVRNHSAIHWWWAHKLFTISLFSIMSLIC